MVTGQAHFSTSSSIVLHFLLSLNKRGRRKAFWVLRAFRGAALKIVPIVGIRRALPKAPIFGLLPHSTTFWLEVYPPPFQRGLLGMTVSDDELHMWGQYLHAHFIFLQHRSAARHQCWSYSRHKKTFVFLECMANRSASG